LTIWWSVDADAAGQRSRCRSDTLAAQHQFHLAHQLAIDADANRSPVISVKGPKCRLPTAATIASTGPTRSNKALMRPDARCRRMGTAAAAGLNDPRATL
jgi:hypothetical protein